MVFSKDDSYISPESVGGKIKKYRELKGWSQMKLGLECGFPPTTADVRIAHYEKNRKVPKKEVRKQIADALGISEYALEDTSVYPRERIYQELFTIEDKCAIHPVKIDGVYYLEVDKSKYHELYDFLDRWYNKNKECSIDVYDSAEEKDEKSKEYAIWKGSYSRIVAEEGKKQLRQKRANAREQRQIDIEYARKNSESEMAKLNAVVEAVISNDGNQIAELKNESDLILCILNLLKSGSIMHHSLLELNEGQLNKWDCQLLSIEINSILDNKDALLMLASIIKLLDALNSSGVKTNRHICSKNKKLLFTIAYESDYHQYFSNVDKYWNDLVFIAERVDSWSKDEIDELESKLKEKITGDNDVTYLIK